MAAESKKLPTIEGFTPGPWLIGVGRICCEVKTSDDRYYAFTVEDEPNAHLIAAAPDLYCIAHEQREVIYKLTKALRYLDDPSARVSDCMRANADILAKEALDAAAPFLED